MSKAAPEILTVAEVCELPAGDSENASWINPGFMGVIRQCTRVEKGKLRWVVIVADTTGSATIESAFFKAPNFEEGDQVEFSGKGLRRTEYNGKPQFAVGKDTEIHVLGKSVHHQEQKQRAEDGEPALNGALQPINGQTVGMALKEAIELQTRGLDSSGVAEQLRRPGFWEEVSVTASDIIRVSRMLEKGKLSPRISERFPSNHAVSSAPTRESGGRSDPPPPPRTSRGADVPVDEDVPF